MLKRWLLSAMALAAFAFFDTAPATSSDTYSLGGAGSATSFAPTGSDAQSDFIAQSEASMKGGGVYCVSRSAIEEHLKATADTDVDRVHDILWVRKICDYGQGPVRLVILASPLSTKWLRVRVLDPEGPWRKGSKVTLPRDSVVYIRRSSIQ